VCSPKKSRRNRHPLVVCQTGKRVENHWSFATDAVLEVYSDPSVSGRQPFTSFGSSSSDHGLSGTGFHTDKKAMGAGAFGVAGLKSSFAHDPIPLLQTICCGEES
jgi:hypothetical protein